MTTAPERVREPVLQEHELAVATDGLTKRFRSGQVAVDGIDLRVPRGAVFGFLGPNGSGKTTTIRMLLGLIAPTSGSVSVLGSPMPAGAQQVLPRVGALVEGPAFHPYLSGRANLARLDAADGTADPRTARARADAALERVGLANAADKRFRQYSLGMKQRLGLAGALLQPRDLLVLDEPTNGLDPQGTREVRALVRELADDGTTVVVSSHLLSEIEQVCSHVGIMSRGRLLRQGSLAEVSGDGVATLTVSTSPEGVPAAVRVLHGLGLGEVRPGEAQVAAALGSARPEDVTAALVGAGVPVRGLAVARPSLEDLFVQLTGEGFDVAR
ncbi:MAG: transporter related protein [Frankiales bacterium]|nr:transporter related protein [Frankiales bacterium]